MTVLPLLQLTDGLHTSPIEAGQNHVSDALNVVSHDGHLEKRAGSVPFMVLPGLTSQPTVGWSDGWANEPATVSSVVDLTPPYWFTSLYVGYSSTFNRADTAGTVDTASMVSGQQPLGYSPRNEHDVEYWNGSAWVDLPCADLYRPGAVTAGTAVTRFAPWCMAYANGQPNQTQQNSIAFDPPSDWAAKNIAASGAKYWIRFRGLGWAAAGAYVSFQAAAELYTTLCTVQTTENRCIHVQRFNDARGTAHTFAVWLYGDDGKTLKFSLDGVTMTQSEGLQPDGTSRMFSEDTKVSAFYVAANDRVVGHVSGLGWFFFCPSETFVTAPSIYSFEPDNIGTDTPYQNVLAGLRSALPDGTVSCFHQGRVFTANGQTVAWSAPTPYVDLWPFDNEGFIPDAFGNIQGMASVGGVLAIFKRNSVWILQSDGTSDGYYATPIPGGVGCVSPASITQAGNQIFFAAEDGVYTFDGAQVVKVTDAIDGLWNRPAFSSNMEKSVGVFYTPNQQFRLFYPSGKSSTVLDAALYAEISGWATQSSDGPRAASWWPQGKSADTEYGFNATAFCSDSTTDKNRMLIGDRYGVIWEADVGVRDAGQVVKCRVKTHRLNYGSSKKMIVRWAVISQAIKGNFDGTVRIFPEGKEADVQTGVLNLYTAADTTVFTAAGVFVTGGLFSEVPDLAELRNSFSVQGKWFQVELLEENGAPWEFDGLELEVNSQGRRT